MLKVTNMASMVDTALLAIVSDMETHGCDADGKFHFNLRKKSVECGVAATISEILNAQRWFGFGNVLYSSCCPEDNWRRHSVERGTGCARFRLVDASVNMDMHDLTRIADRVLSELKKRAKGYHIIIGESIDYIDLVEMLRNRFGFEVALSNDRPGIIVSDANEQYEHDSLFYDRQVLEVEMKLKECGLF